MQLAQRPVEPLCGMLTDSRSFLPYRHEYFPHSVPDDWPLGARGEAPADIQLLGEMVKHLL